MLVVVVVIMTKINLI